MIIIDQLSLERFILIEDGKGSRIVDDEELITILNDRLQLAIRPADEFDDKMERVQVASDVILEQFKSAMDVVVKRAYDEVHKQIKTLTEEVNK